MIRLQHSTLALAVLAALLAACAQPGTDPSPSDSGRPTRSAPNLATVPPSDDPVLGEVPAEVLSDLIANAAELAGVEVADVEVVQAESVTWNDGSLDCPEPGMFYTQALVDGYHVILEIDGEEFDYRLSTAGNVVLCENGRPGG